MKMNPNNNKHFNDEALRINRMLKKENDNLKYKRGEHMDAMEVLQDLGMNVFDGSDIEFFMKYGITLQMLMGEEEIPQEILDKVKEDMNG